MQQDWEIKPCGAKCRRCEMVFMDQQLFCSILRHEQTGYERYDYCLNCFQEAGIPKSDAISVWKGIFRAPPSPQDILKKETAESLLRKLMGTGDSANRNAVYVLAVMLERKRTLVERDMEQREDGARTIVYEHRKTGEMFMVPDPGLRLDQLEQVQAEVAELLGGNMPREETPAVPPAGS